MTAPTPMVVRVTRVGLPFTLLLFTALASGCRKNRPAAPPPSLRPVLGEVVVGHASSSEVPIALDVDFLAAELRKQLLATELFVTAASDGGIHPNARAALRLESDSAEVGAKGIARLTLNLQIATRPSDAPAAVQEELVARGERPYATLPMRPELSALFSKLALQTSDDLLRGLAARETLKVAPAAEVTAALKRDAGELREEAIRIAGERKLAAAVPDLLRLLHDPEETVRDAALGALIALRERRAVPELAKSRSLKDRREMRKIIEAMAILGGGEARDYLSFVASSHDDDEMRELASEAKRRLELRSAAPDGAR